METTSRLLCDLAGLKHHIGTRQEECEGADRIYRAILERERLIQELVVDLL